MAEAPLDLRFPESTGLKPAINRTEALLSELHQSAYFLVISKLSPTDLASGEDFFSNASVLREPIFYGGESAFIFNIATWLSKNTRKMPNGSKTTRDLPLNRRRSF